MLAFLNVNMIRSFIKVFAILFAQSQEPHTATMRMIPQTHMLTRQTPNKKNFGIPILFLNDLKKGRKEAEYGLK